MCVANPLLLADLDVANPVCYARPVVGPQAPLRAAQAAPTGVPAALHLPDYGLCAYDAGLADFLGQALLKPAGALDRLVLAPARWHTPALDATSDPVPVAPGLTYRPSTDGGGVLQVGTAALEGNFAQPGERWRVLPTRYSRGYAVETAVYVGPDALADLATDPTRGTLFYWGTRAANKFWEVGPGTGDFLLNTGVPLTEAHPDDPWRGLALHALGLRAQADGTLVVRWLDEFGELAQAASVPQALGRGWQHVVVSWCPDQALPADPELAECWPFRRGVLRLMVNGRQVLIRDGVPELRLRALDGPASQQYTVPFFLAWGGGTPGLKHAFLPTDYTGTPAPLDAAPSLLETEFSGTLGVGLRRLRLYDGGVTPLVARQLAADYAPRLVWGATDPLLD